MNEYLGKLRWRFDEGSNTDIVDDIGVIDVLDVPMEKSDHEAGGGLRGMDDAALFRL